MILIPAISGVYTIRITKLTLEYLWWRKECPIYTPYVLISYGNLLINPEYQSNIREVAKIDNEVTVMVDSGGLQMYTRGVNIDIESSTRWQLKVGDYILGLDYPLSVKEMFNKEKFLKHAQISATNYKEQLKILGDVAKEKYFAILQGHTNEQLESWWQIAIEPIIDNVFGVAYAPRVKRSTEVINGLTFLKRKGVKRVHLLGATGFKMLTAMKLLDKDFEFLSSDSSTHTKVISRGNILFPLSHSMKGAMVGYRGVRAKINLDDLICRCPVCSKFCNSKISSISMLNTIKKEVIASLHNLFWILCFVDYLNWLERYGKIENFASKYIPEGFKLYKGRDNLLNRWL